MFGFVIVVLGERGEGEDGGLLCSFYSGLQSIGSWSSKQYTHG